MPEKGLTKGLYPGAFTGIDGGCLNGNHKGLFGCAIPIYQPETIAWIKQLASPLPSAFFIFEMDTLIRNLKAASIWKQLDRLWIFATEQQAHARVSIVNPNGINTSWPSSITEQSSPSWTKLKGYKGNAASSYLLTNYNPASNANNFTLNSSSIGFYSIGTESNQYAVPMGGYTQIASINYIIRVSTPVWSPGFGKYYYTWGLNEANTGTLILGAAQTPVTGMFSAVRSLPSGSAMFQNGNVIATESDASNAIPSFNIPIIASNFNGTMSDYSSNTFSMAFIGSGNINQALLYNYIHQFMGKIGINV
jgi:hypothetical protein